MPCNTIIQIILKYMQKLITIIIPIRLSSYLYEGEERLERIINNIPSNLFEILIIDYGTQSPYKELFNKFVVYDHISVYDAGIPLGEPFSIGAARDLGAQYAKTKVIMFHDVDFSATSDMYEKIHVEVEARQIETQKARDFLCIPVAFLNQKGTFDFSRGFNNKRKDIFNHSFHQKLLTRSQELCDFIVYGSSAIVVNRYNYLLTGGHDRMFVGHGAEDYELLHKLAKGVNKVTRPKLYYKDTKNNQILNYKGFRAFFAVFGIDVFYRGIFFSHLWHPRREMPDYFQSEKNFNLLKNLMRLNDKNTKELTFLEDKNVLDKTLILSKKKSSFCESIHEVLPLMGEVVFVCEDTFQKSDDLLSFISSNRISKVGFKNPYGNTHRLDLYKSVREANISYWVMDRGALPDSWFFDSNGFNADSSSYNRDVWDVPLTEEQSFLVNDYINEICSGSNTLEKNGPRQDLSLLKEKIGVNNRKVLLIPFQRPSDSVCRYFSGKAESSEGFNEIIRNILNEINEDEWLVVGKKHPLEKTRPNIKGIYFVSDEIHIYDLLEISDKVCLLNSGVGLLAAMFQKPVIYLGNAFYGFEGLNFEAHSAEQAVELINNNSLFVKPKVLEQFIYHLITKVYSFADTSYMEVHNHNNKGDRYSIAVSMRFLEIRGLSDEAIYLGSNLEKIDTNEPIFYSFGGSKGIANRKEFGVRFLQLKRSFILKVFMFFAFPFTSKKKLMKLKRSPEAFFRDTNNRLSKFIGKILDVI